MILAAGRGERMRPLTDTIPKPLLPVGGKSLIEYQIERLAIAGFKHIIINLSYLGEKIVQTLGNGAQYGVQLCYSPEGRVPLGTGGGIFNALPLLGNQHFLVVNGDIWCDYPYTQLRRPFDRQLAHLILVDNPQHHPQGDFCLADQRVYKDGDAHRLTFSGIGMYHPDLFKGCQKGEFSLVPLLVKAMQAGRVSGEHYRGTWSDIGTPERLQLLEKQLANR